MRYLKLFDSVVGIKSFNENVSNFVIIRNYFHNISDYDEITLDVGTNNGFIIIQINYREKELYDKDELDSSIDNLCSSEGYKLAEIYYSLLDIEMCPFRRFDITISEDDLEAFYGEAMEYNGKNRFDQEFERGKLLVTIGISKKI